MIFFKSRSLREAPRSNLFICISMKKAFVWFRFFAIFIFRSPFFSFLLSSKYSSYMERALCNILHLLGPIFVSIDIFLAVPYEHTSIVYSCLNVIYMSFYRTSIKIKKITKGTLGSDCKK